jgi:very-short-patch-repair endonuclease
MMPSDAWRLIVELDSRLHHTDWASYEKDRARDLVTRGYVVVRVTYRQVMQASQTVEAAILAITRPGEHRWQRLHRQAGLDLRR